MSESRPFSDIAVLNTLGTQALRRFETIRPLLFPESFPRLSGQFTRKKTRLVKAIAHESGVAPRTVYHWLRAWKKGGLAGLAKKSRADRGLPRALNKAAAEFLLTVAVGLRGACDEPTIRAIFRAYQAEREWRHANSCKNLGEFERCKYRSYLNPAGQLDSQAQLPNISYETLRVWLRRIPDLIEVAFHSKGGHSRH